MNISDKQVLTVLKPVLHKACWHVSVGGSTLPTFSLAIGGKSKRRVPLRNMAQPALFRKNDPEMAFFVWCAWRLDKDDGVVVSHEGVEREITRGLARIVGNSVSKIDVTGPAWDLVLHFENALRLAIFCDHAGKNPHFNGNWQARVQRTRVYAGPGEKIKIKEGWPWMGMT